MSISPGFVIDPSGVFAKPLVDGWGFKVYGSTSGYFAIKAHAVAGSTIWTWPAADGTSGQVFSTDGNGNISLITVSGGGGTPGGSNGQIQYNNVGVFGGFTVSGDATLVSSTGVLTLATVNANVGTFTKFVVNGKGLITAAGTLIASDVPTLNQNTTGSAATLTTPRAINGVNFDGSAAITITAASGTLTGTVLNSTVVTSSLTAVGTLVTGVWQGTLIGPIYGGTGVNNGSNTLTVGASASISGSNTGDQTSVTGNAGTATALQTGRNINGVLFDGTANITVTAAAGTLTGTTLNATVVSSSLTSLGTIATGIWQGSVVGGTYGGTGVNNGASTITLAGNLVHSGAFSTTITVTGTTTVTLPTSGTLVNTTVATLSSLTSIGTIGTGTWQGTKVGLLYGGTNSDLSGTGGTHQFLAQVSTGAAITVVQPAESDLSFTDITTGNVNTTKHGFAPKAPNDATKYLDGTGAYSVPAGGGGGTITLTGDVTGSGTTSIATTIAANAVSHAKFAQSTAYTVVGNATSGTANVTDLSALILGTPSYTTSGANFSHFTLSANSFAELALQNTAANSSASTDFVVTADNGSDTTHYGNWGINSSLGGVAPFTGANALYLYSTDNEVDIGAIGTTGVINFYTGGSAASNLGVVISAAQLVSTQAQSILPLISTTVPMQIAAMTTVALTVTNKVLTTNVATLTYTGGGQRTVGETVVVTGVDATFNGTFTITAVGSNTLSYAKVNANVGTAASSGTITLTQTADLFQTKISGGTLGNYARITAAGCFSNTGTQTGSEVYGDGATVSGTNSVVIGNGASGAGTNVVIGKGATSSTATSCIILGNAAAGIGGFNNSFIAGSSTTAMANVYFAKGPTNAAATAFTIFGTGGSGSNNAGGNVSISPGLSTGTQTPAVINLQGTATTSSGATAQSNVTVLQITNSLLITTTDAVNHAFGTTTGNKIGTATTQKLGFWNAAPIVQPAGANQAAITDSTGGTPSVTFTLVDVTAVPTQANINNNFATLNAQCAAIRTALVNSGLIKGSA